jgi:hypothetical protein
VTKGSRIIAVPSFDTKQRLDAIAPAGASVKDIVDFALPGATPDVLPFVRVSIGEDIVPREMWQAVRPKPNAVVLVRVLPGNSGVLRSALSIAVGVAAIALGQFYLGPVVAGALGFAAGSAGATAVGSFITATTLLAGTFLINALIPLRQDQSRGAGIAESPTYNVQGFRNVANPEGVVPCALGKVRFSPPFAALPYTEINFGEVYARALFLVGYGPVTIENIRIGDTPIERFKEITYEVREGYDTDLPQTLYPKQVLEERLSIDLNVNYATLVGVHSRFTASDADEAQVDISFPNGLFWMHTARSGSSSVTYPIQMTVEIHIEYRLNGTGAWTTAIVWNITDFTQKPSAYSYRWKFPARGRYEVRVVRFTPDFDDLNAFDQDNQYVTTSIWSALRTFRPEYPLNFNKPLALIAVKVRSSKQLNGILDSLNCEATRVCLDWDTGTQTWIERETQNPASLYRYALQGAPNAYPVTDDEIDLEQLQEWHEFCDAEGLTYNRVHDYEASRYDVMADICAAGRAAPRDDGEKWGVVIDRKQTVTIAHMTPRNAWNFSGERPYVIFPEAFRVKFKDETNSYKDAERVVPWPGFVGTPAITESIDLPGVTNPDQVWLEARKRQYELIHRRDTFQIMQDFEGAIARRGDLVRLSYDVLNSTQLAARVKDVSGNVVTIDDWVTMESGKTYALRIRKLATTEGGNDQSILRGVQTVPGETNALVLLPGGVAPEAGDLVMFGESSEETMECIVREAEGAEDFARSFTLIPHAPEIFDLLAAETPPAWNGRVGEDVSAGPGVNQLSVDFLVVGGGAGGGSDIGGGGGGGAVIESSATLNLATAYALKVGAGGAAGANGVSSIFNTQTAAGGLLGVDTAGDGGASGGGDLGGTGQASLSGGGGGGVGHPGNNGSAVIGVGGTGGAGFTSALTGLIYSSGGSGGGSIIGGIASAPGGAGGGGAVAGSNGTANRGGGGGGGGTSQSGGSGGSGVVVLKIPSTNSASFSGGVTQTNTTLGGFKIYTITAAAPGETVTFS